MKTLVILVGIPGSGKTSYAQELVNLGYVRISQDAVNGNRAKTTEAFNNALNEGKNIVLDRCNINKDQRRPWVNKAMSAGYEERIAVLFETTKEECVERVSKRKGHETIPETTPIDKIKRIVYGFHSSKEDPQFAEGFTAIVLK